MMTMIIRHSASALFLFSCASLSFAQTHLNHDLPIELVEVSATATHGDGEQLLSSAPVTRPVHDAGELLRSVTGMTALRRGGRGFDPIIRGQSRANLNVIANGAFNYGACPGRMDPPSTYISSDSFDSVRVIKGHRSVVYGAGGSGGTLLFEHQRPDFSDSPVRGEITAGYTGNSDLRSSSADIATGNEQAYLRVFGSKKRSDNYRDGGGDTVASAFQSDSFGIVAGADITASDYLEINHERAFEDDVWYAGNGMDAPYADSESSSLRWHHHAPIGPIDSLELTLYRSDVVHLMDNYTVRQRNTMANGMAAPSSSDTWGGRLLAGIERDSYQLQMGLDYRANARKALLYMDAGKDGQYEMLLSRMWPDAELRQRGVFAELDYRLSNVDTLRIGTRYDQFNAAARSANVTTGMMGSATPAALYANAYGVDARPREREGISAVLGWDRQLSEQLLLSSNLSRSLRAPDSSELWMARSAMGSTWIGNPALDPELHQQLDISLIGNHEQSQWSVTVFGDEVHNYIERYETAAGDRYRNISASLYGAEFDASRTLGESLRAGISLSYTRGEGDNGDLAQIAPLEARVKIDYERERWAVGAEWLIADRQSHFNSAVDVDSATPGFAVLHVFGHWQLTDALLLEAGIENLFDRRYAYHVNAGNADPFTPDALRVNEPGRQSWIKLRYRF